MRHRALLVIGSGGIGGGTTHVLQLVRGLPATGFVPVVAADPDGPLLERARALGAETHAVAFARGRLDPAAIAALRRTIPHLGVDVVHAHGTRAAVACVLTRWIPGAARPPLVYSEHGLAVDVRRSAALRRMSRLAERTVLRRAARIVTATEYGRRTVGEIEPCAASRVRLVPYGVAARHDPDARRRVRAELGLAADCRVVGTVARFVPQKAPLDFVTAAAQIAREVPGTRFLAVGDGPLLPAARDAARAAGVPIVFPGFRDDFDDCLAALDVFALPSLWEAAPHAALHAMAAGLPVVATDVCGTPSIVAHGETGLLVPPSAPQALASAVISLLRDETLARRLGDAARRTVLERNREEDVAPRIAAVYRECLGA